MKAAEPLNLVMPVESYTCVCMYPDYATSDYPEFTRVWVKSSKGIADAQEKAQKIAARRCDADDPYDVAVVAVYAGHLDDIGI